MKLAGTEGRMYTSDKRIYVDDADNIVNEDDPKAARLLVAEGGTLSEEEATRYGLTGSKEQQAAANKARGSAPATRAADVDDPAGNKRASRLEDDPTRRVTRSGIENVVPEREGPDKK